MRSFNHLLQLLAFASIASAQSACGNDLTCLSKLSQYVVLGTVVSNTLNASTRANYNATIAVKCAFASFTRDAPDHGENLAGNTINVSKFGGGSGCPGGFTDAIVNSTQIFFIHVSNYRPALGVKLDYTVVDICVGGVTATSESLNTIGQLMSDYPENVIDSRFRGNDPECRLSNYTPKPKPPKEEVNDPVTDGAASFPWAIVTVVFIFAIALL